MRFITPAIAQLRFQPYSGEMKSRKDLRVARERLDTRQHRLNRSEVELFAAGVAHEFNNVLGAALGHAEWALDSGDPEDMKDSLKTVVRACERAREITWALNRSEKRDWHNPVDQGLWAVVRCGESVDPRRQCQCIFGYISGIALTFSDIYPKIHKWIER